jgi:hypothetical protein
VVTSYTPAFSSRSPHGASENIQVKINASAVFRHVQDPRRRKGNSEAESMFVHFHTRFTPVAILSSWAANFSDMYCGFVQAVSRGKDSLLYPRRAL